MNMCFGRFRVKFRITSRSFQSVQIRRSASTTNHVRSSEWLWPLGHWVHIQGTGGQHYSGIASKHLSGLVKYLPERMAGSWIFWWLQLIPFKTLATTPVHWWKNATLNPNPHPICEKWKIAKSLFQHRLCSGHLPKQWVVQGHPMSSHASQVQCAAKSACWLRWNGPVRSPWPKQIPPRAYRIGPPSYNLVYIPWNNPH